MIRSFIESDIDEIMSIWLESNIKVHNFISKQYWDENYAPVKQAISVAEVYVFIDDKSNEILGFIGLVDNYIAGIFVKESERSKGIGKALLDYVKKIKSELVLDVYDKNKQAINFYKRENFTVQSYNIDEDTKEKECEMVWKCKNFI